MRWKWIFGIAVFLVVAFIVAIYAILSSYDFNDLKPQISQMVKDSTGRELSLGGDLELKIGLIPALVVEDVSFQNVSWGSRPELAKIRAFFMPLASLISSVGIVIIIWYGGNKVIAGSLSLGTVLAFYFYMSRLMGPVRMLGFMTSMFVRAQTAADRVFEIVDRGVSVHPRSGDATYPEFFMQRCTQCKRCTEECPFGALDDDEKGTPLPNNTRCRRCGTCMGSCPERIIGFRDYNIDLIGSMIKSVEVPEEDDDRLRIVVFVCENDAYPALDMAGMKRNGINHMIRFVPVRCLGSVNMAWIRDALSAGMDGAMLLGCTYGDDYQCHFIKGSEIATKRMENIGDTLSTLGLEPERCATEQVAITDYDKIPQILNDFVEEIVEMGPNPFKGF